MIDETRVFERSVDFCPRYEDSLSAEEELLRAAACCPRVPAGLRTRVLTTALRAEQRRTLRRRMFAAACLLPAAVGLAAWISTLPFLCAPSEQAEQAIAQRAAVRAAVEQIERLRSPSAAAAEAMELAGDYESRSTESREWTLVEVTLCLRELQLQSIRTAF